MMCFTVKSSVIVVVTVPFVV